MIRAADLRTFAGLALGMAIAAAHASSALAQFSDDLAPEVNFSAMLPSVGAHDRQSKIFGDGAGNLLILSLENRTIRAMYSPNNGSSFGAPYFVAGAPTGSSGVKSFDAAQVGSHIYLAYVSEASPYGTGVQVMSSSNLGQTWSLETTIAAGNAASAPVRDVRVAAGGNVAAVLYWGNDNFDPFASVSTDLGFSFGSPVRLDAGAPSDRFQIQSAAVTVTAAGTVCVAFTQDRTDHYWWAPNVYVTRSTDGVTFAAETAVVPPDHNWSMDVELRTANDGAILLAFWDSPLTGANDKIYVYRSTNAGASYAAASNISLPLSGIEVATHLAVAASPGTTVLMGYIDNAGAVKIHRSTDNGATYGAAATLAASATSDSHLPIVPTAAGWVVGWTDKRADSYTGANTDVYARVSTDDGVTWKAEKSAGAGSFPSPIQGIADAGDPGTGRRAYVSYLDGASDSGRSLDLNGARLAVGTGLFDFDRQDAGDVEQARPRTEIGAAVAADGAGRVLEAFAATSTGPYPDIFVARSSDGAYTFSTPVRVGSTAAGTRFATDPRIVAIAGGPVYLVYSSDNPGVGREIRFTRSLDGGATWQADAVLATVAGYPAGSPENDYPRAQILAVDSRVWVLWSTGSDVFLARSSDQGASFTTADVDQDSRGFNRDPRMCVSGSRVVLAYSSLDVAGIDQSVWGTVSENSGATWTTHVQLRPEAAANNAGFPIAICHSIASPVVIFADSRSGVRYELRSAVYQSPGGWAADTAVAMPAGEQLGFFDAAYVANGNALVAYSDLATGRLWRAGAFTAGSFTDLLALDGTSPNPGALSYSPRIASAGGWVWVGWLEDTFGGPEMVINRGFDDLTFTGIQRADDVLPQGSRQGTLPTRPSGPELVAEGNRVHIAWTSERASGLPEALYTVVDLDDNDRDHVPGTTDCNDWDPSVFAVPVEAAGVQLAKVTAATRLTWTTQSGTAGPSTRYDVIRGPLGALRSSGGFGSASCLANDVPSAALDDGDPDPAAGDGVYYLVRAQNGCGTATYGNSTLAIDPRDTLDSASPCP